MFRVDLYTIKCIKTILEYISIVKAYSGKFLIHIFHLGYNINRKLKI